MKARVHQLAFLCCSLVPAMALATRGYRLEVVPGRFRTGAEG